MSDALDSAGAAQPVDAAVAAWEDPPRVDRTDAAPILTVDGFAGPLDWWLDLARAQKIDFAKISIAALIGTFATALEAALPSLACSVAKRSGARLEPWAGWTVMAATLTELWSRLLLPPDAPAARAAVAEAEALRRHLLERARMGAAADWLDQRPQLGRDGFRRGQPELNAASRGGDLTDLLRACLPALHVPEDTAVALRPRPPPLWTATDARAHVARLLGILADGSKLTEFLPRIPEDAPARALACRVALASTLIASLELARDGTVGLEQAADWTPIHVTRRGNSDAAADDPESPA
jgi:segregation and condensation protein A